MPKTNSKKSYPLINKFFAKELFAKKTNDVTKNFWSKFINLLENKKEN